MFPIIAFFEITRLQGFAETGKVSLFSHQQTLVNTCHAFQFNLQCCMVHAAVFLLLKCVSSAPLPRISIECIVPFWIARLPFRFYGILSTLEVCIMWTSYEAAKLCVLLRVTFRSSAVWSSGRSVHCNCTTAITHDPSLLQSGVVNKFPFDPLGLDSPTNAEKEIKNGRLAMVCSLAISAHLTSSHVHLLVPLLNSPHPTSYFTS